MLTFPEWQKQFLKRLKSGTPAWHAFEKWCKKEEQSQKRNARLFPNLPARPSPRDVCMHSLYTNTEPFDEAAYTKRKDVDNRTIKLLDDLVKKVEQYVGMLRKRPPTVNSCDDLGASGVEALLAPFLAATEETKAYLSLLRPSHCHQPDNIDQSIAVLITLLEVKAVTGDEAASLVRIAFLAHGCSEDDVDVFSPASVRSGTIRKRIQARRHQAVALIQNLAKVRRRKI